MCPQKRRKRDGKEGSFPGRRGSESKIKSSRKKKAAFVAVTCHAKHGFSGQTPKKKKKKKTAATPVTNSVFFFTSVQFLSTELFFIQFLSTELFPQSSLSRPVLPRDARAREKKRARDRSARALAGE
jgi:hypothetical protein